MVWEKKSKACIVKRYYHVLGRILYIMKVRKYDYGIPRSFSNITKIVHSKLEDVDILSKCITWLYRISYIKINFHKYYIK